MAVSDNYTPTKTLGNGATVQFTAAWNVIAAAYIRVYLENVTTGVQVLQVRNTDYTLTFSDSGLTVDFTIGTPPPNTEYVIIARSIDLTQTDPYKVSQGFQGAVVENSLDKVTSITQDIQDQVDRSLKFPIASGKIGSLPDPEDGASLVWNGTTGALENGPTTSEISSAEGFAEDAAISATAAEAAATSAAAAAALVPLSKYNATTAPTVNDDTGDGYGIGSAWVDITHDRVYICVDATLTAAIWKYIANDTINVKDLGAIGDGSTDDRTAFVNAFAAAVAAKKSIYIPFGNYKISSTITVPTFTVGGRSVIPPIKGDGYTVSIISFTGTGKTFDFSAGEAIIINGLQITTSTGGGIGLGDCGGLHLDGFYMNGCAAGEWAIEQSGALKVVYTATIDNSRFWASNGYLGGVMNIHAALDLKISNTFISQQRKDGAIIAINYTRNFIIDNVQFEAVGSVTTGLTFITFDGECYNFSARNIYLEGTWDKFVSVVSANLRCAIFENIFAWQYAGANGGKASPVLIDSNINYTSTRWHVDGLIYLNSHTSAGTGYIIDDPFNNVSIRGYQNISSGNQANRFLSQRHTLLDITSTEKNAGISNERAVDEVRIGGVQNTNQGSGAATSWTLYLPTDRNSTDINKIIEGVYLLSVTVRSADFNHSTTQVYIVAFDNNTNDYTSVNALFASAINKGTNPTSLAVTVTNAGVLTVTANQGSGITQAHEIQAYWKRLQNL